MNFAYYEMLTNQESTVERELVKARRYISQLVDFFGQECYSMIEQIQTEKVKELLFCVVVFHSYFYGHSKHDYYITSLTSIQASLDIRSA